MKGIPASGMVGREGMLWDGGTQAREVQRTPVGWGEVYCLF